MSASGKTPNFDFPLYEVQDNFAPLTSFNLLSTKADQQLALVKSSADTAEALSSANEQDIQALETWKAGLMSSLAEFLSPNILTFTKIGTMDYHARAFTNGVNFFFSINSQIEVSALAIFPFIQNNKLYVIAKSANTIFDKSIDSIHAIYGGPCFGRVGAGDSSTIYIPDIYVWQDSNILYFGIALADDSPIITSGGGYAPRFSCTFFIADLSRVYDYG